MAGHDLASWGKGVPRVMISVMDEDEFWEIVASTRSAATGTIAEQPSALRELLSRRPVVDALAFQRNLDHVSARADTRDLGHAAGLLLGGVGSDGFTDFRTWLVCHGRATFERVLADPDTIVDLSYDENEEDFGHAEQFGYVAPDLYEERTGDEAPTDDDVPATNYEPYDQAALRARFPRLWVRAEGRHPEYLELRQTLYHHVHGGPG
jgi:hypothetical protein